MQNEHACTCIESGINIVLNFIKRRENYNIETYSGEGLLFIYSRRQIKHLIMYNFTESVKNQLRVRPAPSSQKREIMSENVLIKKKKNPFKNWFS